MYFIQIEDIYISLAFLGDYNIPLGALLELWEQGLLIDFCDQCHSKLYIYNAGGSPLSGRNQCLGLCLNCGDVVNKSINSMGTLVQALKYVKDRQNVQVIKKIKRQYFSFSKGLDGEPDAEQIVNEGVTPVSIFQLIQEVRK